jgi:DNA gyrase subunit A
MSDNEERLSVVDRPISDEMADSYMQYAMSVIKSRALPDVRDGLKPSQRRVLYDMAHDLSLHPNKQRMKSARVVGDTMGRYHPHGDSAIYMTLVRMAQAFASRYLMVDPKGNFGSVINPSPAAMRYTECRMARAASDMVADLDLGTVDMVANYDGQLREPTVLPSKFPNLVCNGSQGIAVGMATSIPPHNKTEVCNALIALAKNPELSFAELLEMIPGPDFPTGGIICGTSGIRKAYKTGRGHLTVRGRVEIETKKDKATIKITELPYQVTTGHLMEKISLAYKAGKIEGVSDLRDFSQKDVDIRVFCKKGEDPEVVLNQLYKFTPLQSTFSIIMIALDENGSKPRTFALQEMLEAFVAHRYDVIRRRTKFLRNRCLARIHILEGLQAALDMIDEVIALIRASGSTDEARDGLRELLKITGDGGEVRPITIKQANAILDMRLQKLTGLERDKLAAELKEKRDEAADYLDILKKPARVTEIFIKETEEIRSTSYQSKQDKDLGRKGDDRRTEIQLADAEDIDVEDLIADEEMVVTVTHKGYIKRTSLDAYRVQGRAGKGSYGANTRNDDDFVTQLFQASSKAYLLCFTSHGRVHWLKVYRIPEGSRSARGRGLRNVIALLPDETVNSIIPVEGEFAEDQYVVMATAQGVIKKTSLRAFARPKKGGIIAVKLDEEDQLIGVRITDGQRELVLASRHGKAIRFNEGTVRGMGRVSRGVKGMQLEEGDAVVSVVVVGEDGPQLLTCCELGYGKRTEVEDYRETNRGGKGIINIKTTARNGYVTGVRAVKPGDHVMLVTTSGKLIRMPVDEISCIGRNTQGVRLIKVEDGETVVAVAKVQEEDEDEAEVSAE